MIINKKMKETIAGQMMAEMVSMVANHGIPKSTSENAKIEAIDGPLLARLIEKNFSRIDTNNDGISKKELAMAMSTPQLYSNDEYTMLKLLSVYFNSIASLCDDQEEGEKVRITKQDKDVLIQFLKYSKMSLQDISDWLALNERSVAPPPMS